MKYINKKISLVDGNPPKLISCLKDYKEKQVLLKKMKNNSNNLSTLKIAHKFKEMLKNSETPTKAALARKLGISRARVTQYMNLLKINKKFTSDNSLSERQLRQLFSGRFYS